MKHLNEIWLPGKETFFWRRTSMILVSLPFNEFFKNSIFPTQSVLFSFQSGSSQSKSTNNTATDGISNKCFDNQFIFNIPFGMCHSYDDFYWKNCKWIQCYFANKWFNTLVLVGKNWCLSESNLKYKGDRSDCLFCVKQFQIFAWISLTDALSPSKATYGTGI